MERPVYIIPQTPNISSKKHVIPSQDLTSTTIHANHNQFPSKNLIILISHINIRLKLRTSSSPCIIRVAKTYPTTTTTTTSPLRHELLHTALPNSVQLWITLSPIPCTQWSLQNNQNWTLTQTYQNLGIHVVSHTTPSREQQTQCRPQPIHSSPYLRFIKPDNPNSHKGSSLSWAWAWASRIDSSILRRWEAGNQNHKFSLKKKDSTKNFMNWGLQKQERWGKWSRTGEMKDEMIVPLVRILQKIQRSWCCRDCESGSVRQFLRSKCLVSEWSWFCGDTVSNSAAFEALHQCFFSPL